MAPSSSARTTGEAWLNCLRLEPGGGVGEHSAATSQLFVVQEGSGRVRASGEEAPVEAGRAVLWDTGEEHESRAGADGIAAVVLEADHLSRP